MNMSNLHQILTHTRVVVNNALKQFSKQMSHTFRPQARLQKNAVSIKGKNSRNAVSI